MEILNFAVPAIPFVLGLGLYKHNEKTKFNREHYATYFISLSLMFLAIVDFAAILGFGRSMFHILFGSLILLYFISKIICYFFLRNGYNAKDLTAIAKDKYPQIFNGDLNAQYNLFKQLSLIYLWLPTIVLTGYYLMANNGLFPNPFYPVFIIVFLLQQLVGYSFIKKEIANNRNPIILVQDMQKQVKVYVDHNFMLVILEALLYIVLFWLGFAVNI